MKVRILITLLIILYIISKARIIFFFTPSLILLAGLVIVMAFGIAALVE